MPTYQYRCDQDGLFDLDLPAGSAGRSAACPRCDMDGVRVFSAPMLARTARPVAAAIERAERSRDCPEVVSAPPPRPNRRRPRTASPNPALARLPRP